MDNSINNSNSSFSSTGSNSNSDNSNHTAQRRRRRVPRRALSIPSRSSANNTSSNVTRGVFRSSTFESRIRPLFSGNHSNNDDDLTLPLVASDLPSPSATTTTTPPLARIHSGSAVAGFVVGTTFEAALMGWLACLHVNGCLEDPPLFLALMALFVCASWSGIFHVVLQQMDVLLEMAHNTPLALYTYFSVGLAAGLGLECAILHRILQGGQASLLLSQPQGILGLVSIVFGLGCVGLTVVRTYWRMDHSKRVFPRKSHHHKETKNNSLV